MLKKCANFKKSSERCHHLAPHTCRQKHDGTYGAYTNTINYRKFILLLLLLLLCYYYLYYCYYKHKVYNTLILYTLKLFFHIIKKIMMRPHILICSINQLTIRMLYCKQVLAKILYSPEIVKKSGFMMILMFEVVQYNHIVYLLI